MKTFLDNFDKEFEKKIREILPIDYYPGKLVGIESIKSFFHSYIEKLLSEAIKEFVSGLKKSMEKEMPDDLLPLMKGFFQGLDKYTELQTLKALEELLVQQKEK